MTDLISKYLLIKKEVKIPDFGSFKLIDSAAFYDEKSAAFLPPGKEIIFEVNYDLKDLNLTDFLAKEGNKSTQEISDKLIELTTYWKNTLEAKHELEIQEFGNFYTTENSLVFKGKRFSRENPDNFGLEKINLSELKTKSLNFEKPSETDYKTNNNKLWWLLFIIPAAAIVYFTTQKPELIFGKKSFKNLNKTKIIPILKKGNIKSDTIKPDSIPTQNNINAKK
ncbi:hypothetical protein [Halpernia sp.]|uniref:HU domain-containing protein n=1 Tax=Halpernia sp. TaxID=2782209 RepID=UPI003A9126BC